MIEESAGRRASIFAALQYRDFRLLWLGLLISNLGTWMQFTAMGFFVARMAGSPHRAALELGILGAARAIPVLLLSPLAGVVADRLPRRRVLFVTNTTMAFAALMLAVLATTHRLDLASLIVLSGLNSAANGFDSPVRQSWVPLLVDRQYVGNAVGLNSVAFNAPAVIGPAFAGLLIVWVGVAGAFYFNAAATLAVVAAVIMMRPSPPSAARREPTLQAMRLGIVFIARHPALRWILFAQLVTAILTRPYGQLIPALAVNVLHAGARGLGWAVSAAGVGGFGGALVTAYFAQRERRSRLWLQSGLLMSLGVSALAFVPTIAWALPVLFTVGVGTLATLGVTNTLIQMLSPDDVRGRALSIYTMIAIGVVPLGSLVDGAIAAVIGLRPTFALAGVVCVAMFLAIWFAAPAVRRV
ncbi:MAG: MFS transporter [Candidatus Eremiobacteraeota bacterium]|nr:MFS transporter [Candidatus Eremiobacteraeota bacterium]